MPKAAGWTERFVFSRAVATGTASLVVSVPPETQPNDTLLLILGHKGATFGTVPAGWTLVARDVSGTTRAEVYWRRASSEPASYTITDLGTVAMGVIVPYAGGRLTDPVIDVFSVRANASGIQAFAPAITPTVPHALLVAILVSGAAENTLIVRTARNPAVPGEGPVDPTIDRFVERRQSSTATGGGMRMVMSDLVKLIPGATGEPYLAAPGVMHLTGTSVGFLLALQPETAAETAGTRYYFSSRYPTTHLWGPRQGGWQADGRGPRPDVQDYLWRLSQTKPDAGVLSIDTLYTNHTPQDVLYGRWVTPPLAAQTLGGTLTFTMLCDLRREPTDSPVCAAQFKIHAYVTVGQSTAVRTTLVDQVVDPVSWTTPYQFRSLQAPLTVPAAAVQVGDSVLVELGVRITLTSGTWPVPSIPPGDWVLVNLHRGATTEDAIFGQGYYTGVGVEDGPDPGGTAIPEHWASHLDFSQTIVEQAPTNPIPTFVSPETARVIPSLPYTDGPWDTSRVPTIERTVWYKWTAPQAGRMFFHAFGSYYRVHLEVYLDPVLGTSGGRVFRDDDQVFTSMAVVGVAAQVGETYYFALSSKRDNLNAPCSGGMLRVAAAWRQPAAHNDVILATTGYLARYNPAGILTEITPAFSGNSLSGLAIDYTRRPLTHWLTSAVHTADRLYVGVFGLDYVEILDLDTMNIGESELDILSDPLASANRHLSSLAITPDGRLVVGWFGNGFTWVGDAGASYLAQVATLNSAAINVCDALHADEQPDAPFPPAAVYPVTLEAGGTNYLEVAPGGQTLFYTSGGWYVPVGGQTIYRLDLTTGTPLPVFATVPVGPGINPGLKGVAPLRDGGCLACNGGEVVRLNAAGVVTHHYVPTPSDRAQSLADVEVDSDEAFFWVLDERTTTLFKFNLATGVQVIDRWTQLGAGTCTSIVVYRRPGPPPVSPKAPRPSGLKMHYYGYAMVPGGVLGLVPGSRLELLLASTPHPQTLGVKVDSSQPLGNPWVADQHGFYSTYVVPAPLDHRFDYPDDTRAVLADALVLDPRVGDLEQRVAVLQRSLGGS